MTRDVVFQAVASGRPVRLHARDGEVLVARILDADERGFRFAVVTSSRPERYGVCDSTGFLRDWDEIERVTLLAEGQERPRQRQPRHR
jgi:hypothetical protein